MLVLRRKTGEALVINGAVTVTVLAVEGERVKLGVIAPEQVVVVREELIDAEAQRAHLRRKREELARETDPRTREKLARSLARLEQSMQLMQPTIAPESREAREEARP
jgi:carbon storage regulator